MYSNSLKSYHFIRELSIRKNGKFGNYVLSKHIPNNQHVAIQKFCFEGGSYDNLKIICDEITLMRQFCHPNINSVLHSFVERSTIYIVYPLSLGSCKDILKNYFKTGFPEILISLIIRDILLGLIYLHRHGFIHGSIRANHILLNQSRALITNFRETRCLIINGKRLKVVHGLSSHCKDSINWLAPEVLEQNLNGYTEKSDIYSLGILCCELANGIHPFFDTQPTFMFTEKVRGNIPTLLDQSTCPAVEDNFEANITRSSITKEIQKVYSHRVFSEDFHQLIEICMDLRPTNRWSATQLLSHSFFKQCKSACLLDQLKRLGISTSANTKATDVHIKSNYIWTEDDYTVDLTWDFK